MRCNNLILCVDRFVLHLLYWGSIHHFGLRYFEPKNSKKKLSETSLIESGGGWIFVYKNSYETPMIKTLVTVYTWVWYKFLWLFFFFTQNVGVTLYTGNLFDVKKNMHFQWPVALYTGKFFSGGNKINAKKSFALYKKSTYTQVYMVHFLSKHVSYSLKWIMLSKVFKEDILMKWLFFLLCFIFVKSF